MLIQEEDGWKVCYCTHCYAQLVGRQTDASTRRERSRRESKNKKGREDRFCNKANKNKNRHTNDIYADAHIHLHDTYTPTHTVYIPTRPSHSASDMPGIRKDAVLAEEEEEEEEGVEEEEEEEEAEGEGEKDKEAEARSEEA